MKRKLNVQNVEREKEGCNFRKGGMKDGMDYNVCIYLHM